MKQKMKKVISLSLITCTFGFAQPRVAQADTTGIEIILPFACFLVPLFLLKVQADNQKKCKDKQIGQKSGTEKKTSGLSSPAEFEGNQAKQREMAQDRQDSIEQAVAASSAG